MDNLQLPEGSPVVIQWLLWFAMGSASVVVIVRNVRKSRVSELVSFIAHELKPNSGGSLKDVVLKAAKDAKESVELVKQLTVNAVEAAKAAKVAAAAAQKAAEVSDRAYELARRMDGRTRRIASKQKKYIEKVDRIAQRMDELSMGHEKLEDRLDEQDKTFARYVDHEARNDLQRSMLLQEERRLLEEESKTALPENGHQ